MKNGESRVLIRIENMNRPFRSSIFMDARQRYERKFSLKWKINDWPLGKQSDTNALSIPLQKRSTTHAIQIRTAVKRIYGRTVSLKVMTERDKYLARSSCRARITRRQSIKRLIRPGQNANLRRVELMDNARNHFKFIKRDFAYSAVC